MGTQEDTGKPLEAQEGFDGPVKRRCTDLMFMVLLISAWVAMTVIGADSVSKGNPDKLINGVDYAGRICGVDAEVKDLPKMYYIRFDGTGVCAAACPATTDFSKLAVCTAADAQYTSSGTQPLDCTGADANQCRQLTEMNNESPFVGTGDGTCMYQIESVDVLNHCVFTDTDLLAANPFVDLGEAENYMQEFLSDVYQARNWILGFGFGLSFVLGFVYCMLLRIPGVVTLLTWGSIAGVIALFAAVGYGLWNLGVQWADDKSAQVSTYQIGAAKGFGIAGFVLACLFACLALWMRKRIGLANGIMKEAARAINAVPIMVLMPIFEAIGVIAFFIPFVYYGVNLASMGDISTETVNGLEVKKIVWSDETQGRGWYLLFCLFWTTQFVLAMGQIVVALTIVKFYFTRDKSSIGVGTFFTAMRQGMWYHMGTAAFGALIIAIIQMIRAVIAYFQKKAKATGNKIAQYLLCCCQCCFWCLEKCMKFLNKNAYIQTALFATGFCTSAKAAFFLVARNIARVSAVSMISEFIVIIMKVLICMATMGATYLCMKEKIEDQLYSLVAPTIFVGVLAYLVAGVFAELFSMTALTILQCFIADEEMFAPGQRYAQNDLKEYVDKHSKGTASQPKGHARKKSTPTANPNPVRVTTGTS